MDETSTLCGSSPVVSCTTNASPQSQKIEPAMPCTSAPMNGTPLAWQAALSAAQLPIGWPTQTTTEKPHATSGVSCWPSVLTFTYWFSSAMRL